MLWKDASVAGTEGVREGMVGEGDWRQVFVGQEYVLYCENNGKPFYVLVVISLALGEKLIFCMQCGEQMEWPRKDINWYLRKPMICFYQFDDGYIRLGKWRDLDGFEIK